ncbi:MAG TPA: GDSL-type esterase/lipase family protein [Patescibacteria group bacterium]|jgi:hypothetical protein|nr:GDSL-type esterase/lipase family protein [Patescibacteria group bacterium]
MRRNLLLAAIAVAVFFGIVEIGLRLSGRVPTDQLRSPDLQTLDSIPGMFEPGQDYVDRVLPDLPYRVRINALGFRGGEFPLRKAPGTLRILCVGDSYTFGPYVEDDQTFPAMLGRALLEASPPAPGRVEVINAGASGFSIEDELIYLRDKAGPLEPDVVVLGFCQNDILDLKRPRPMIATMREHSRLKSAFVLGPALKLLQRTAIFNGMQRAAAMIRVRQMHADASTDGSATPALWNRYRDLLGQVVDLVRRRNARFLMVVWSSADQIAGKASMEPQERLAGMARDLGFEALDLAPVIREIKTGGANPYFVPIDGHPNTLAYDAAARLTARRLIDLGYLTPAQPRP